MNMGDMNWSTNTHDEIHIRWTAVVTYMNTGDMKYQHTMKNTLGGLPWYTYKYKHGWYEVPTHNEEHFRWTAWYILTNMNMGDMKYQHTMKNKLGGLPWYTYKYKHGWYEVPTHNEEHVRWTAVHLLNIFTQSSRTCQI